MNERLAVVPEMTYLQARQIVQAFGKTIETFAGLIADENKLPFPKAVIKQATLMVIPFAPSEELRSQLKASYLYLADFQPDVKEEVVRTIPTGVKPPSKTDDFAAVAAHIGKGLPWSEQSTAEMQVLLQELRDAGFRD